MIPARTARLIVRSAGTALVVAVVAVLVAIYLRSEGNGTGAPAPLRQASTTRGTGGEQGSKSNGSASSTGGNGGNGGNGGGGNGGSGGSGSSTCAPPRVCGSPAGAGGSSTSSAPATYTGAVVENPYGPVQVSVTEQGGKLVDVKALQMPTEHALSQEISEHVAPMLRTEALQAQSAEINVVSGATYTSEGFASSLQAALRQAG